MTNTFHMPRGYRKLNGHEIIKRGDKFWVGDAWLTTVRTKSENMPASQSTCTYIRKISRKPSKGK